MKYRPLRFIAALMLMGIPLATVSAKTAGTPAEVVTKALAFKALLNSTQQATLEKSFTNALAVKWSNLPCGATCRNGIQFSTLTAPQVAAAMEVVVAASGTSPNEGSNEFQQTRWADSVLAASGGGNNYGAGIFFLAYLNTPTTTGAWMLQFGGHHFAVNIAFNNGQVVGVTPDFKGIEPLTFTAAGVAGTQAPLSQEQAGLVAMFDSLTPAQLASAKVTTTFNDISMGKDNNGPFPTTRIGLSAGTLNSSQQAMVLAAMEPYLLDMDSASAATLRAVYAAEINQTYIAYSGSTAKLNANGNYARIDGPSVWIELSCQAGIVFSATHYHTIWRDRTRDYGQYLAATSLNGGSTAVRPAFRSKASRSHSAMLNATGTQLRMTLTDKQNPATFTITDMRGKAVLSFRKFTGPQADLNVSALRQGAYGVRIEQKGRTFSSEFVKL